MLQERWTAVDGYIGAHLVPCDPVLDAALLDNPHRVGKPLTRGLGGYHSARRGAYRVIYRIDDTERVVHVVRIDHRADVYRTR